MYCDTTEPAWPQPSMSTDCQNATYPPYADASELEDWSTTMPQVEVYDGYVPFTATLDYAQRPGCLHYVPPDAVSTRYYALQDPNVYISDSQIDSGSAPLEAYCRELPSESSSPVSTVSPSSMMDFPMAPSYEHEHDYQTDYGRVDDSPYVYVHPHVGAMPAPSPVQEDLYAPSGSAAYANPDLPTQIKYTDDPSGGTDPLVQPTARYEVDFAALQTTYLPQESAYFSAQQEYVEQNPEVVTPQVVPSQWKLGAALDKLRFPEYEGDWDMVMARITGRPYEQTFPRSPSPLSEEDMARIAEIKLSLGWPDVKRIRREKTPPAHPATPVPDADDSAAKLDPSKMVIYSPTTARRMPVSSGPSGPVLRLPAKRTYKRGTVVACKYCRKRKIGCGGPLESDEARRCL
ncbi:hypothetical protein K466DRAFT_275163 [Polyporus arcularius HHB13444]|uniref:Uncharacterized protein n=1 Tax=Polyporus arcularius HHB13444 TaxID=1314778 RepID=A0A5C3P1B4_9APHY|nr:hypothetical protein K466DRAFT_275163 [Polyporus arcularius HHB13444]